MKTKKLKTSLGFVKEQVYQFKNDKSEGVFECKRGKSLSFIVRVKKRFHQNIDSSYVILTLKKFTNEHEAISFYDSLIKSEIYQQMHSMTVKEFYAKIL